MFFYTSQLKNRKKCEEIAWLKPANLPRFQEKRPNHVRVEHSSYYFPRELVSFDQPRELDSFDPRHVTRSTPIGKHI